MRDVFEGDTEDGMIMTDVDQRHVPEAFDPVLAAAIQAVRERA